MNDSEMNNVESSNVTTQSDRFTYVYLVVVVAMALIIRFFVLAPYLVSGSSMEPNFHDYNYLLVDQISYRLDNPQRGDVIVLDLPQNTSRALIKRIIGLPGETILISGANPIVTIINADHPEGIVLDEPYVSPVNYGGASDMRITLADDQYFVLGDNRHVSADSRIWGILPRADIVGRVLLRLYPFDELDALPSQVRYDASISTTAL
jgi:signal peptidase I